MNTWYQTAIAYRDTTGQSASGTTNEMHLIQAVSYSDAEYTAYQKFGENPDFRVVKITKMTVWAIIDFGAAPDDRWWKAKVTYIGFDEKTQKETRLPRQMLVKGEDLEMALYRLQAFLGGTQDCELESVCVTKISDVIHAEKAEPAQATQENPETVSFQ